VLGKHIFQKFCLLFCIYHWVFCTSVMHINLLLVS